MLTKLHQRKNVQRLLGLLIGIAFGFLLQKGGVTSYDVIIHQLLLQDWTVAKVILAAMFTGMIVIHLLWSLKLVELEVYPGSVFRQVIGGLIFGVGFALIGYCPGTMAGAIGRGGLDALLAGLPGILFGSALYAALYPKIQPRLLKHPFATQTIPELMNVPRWTAVAYTAAPIAFLILVLELLGV